MECKITVTPKTEFINPVKVLMEFTVYPGQLLKEEANLDKVAMSLTMSGKHALRKQLEILVNKQANLIAATTGSST